MSVCVYMANNFVCAGLQDAIPPGSQSDPPRLQGAQVQVLGLSSQHTPPLGCIWLMRWLVLAIEHTMKSVIRISDLQKERFLVI